MPLNRPVAFIEAIAGLPLLHAPPLVPSVSVVDAPWHIVAVPLTLPTTGIGSTVTRKVAVALPQLLEIE